MVAGKTQAIFGPEQRVPGELLLEDQVEARLEQLLDRSPVGIVLELQEDQRRRRKVEMA